MHMVASVVLYHNWRISLEPERSRCPRFGDFVACTCSGWRCDYPDVSDPWQTTITSTSKNRFGAMEKGRVFSHRNHQKLFWDQTSWRKSNNSTAVVFFVSCLLEGSRQSLNQSLRTFSKMSPGILISISRTCEAWGPRHSLMLCFFSL